MYSPVTGLSVVTFKEEQKDDAVKAYNEYASNPLVQKVELFAGKSISLTEKDEVKVNDELEREATALLADMLASKFGGGNRNVN
jgi:hypothetical protein